MNLKLYESLHENMNSYNLHNKHNSENSLIFFFETCISKVEREIKYIVFSTSSVSTFIMPDQKKQTGESHISSGSNENASGKNKKLYDVSFFHSWCKSCGICVEFCPKKIIKSDKTGEPEIFDTDSCIGCRFCEIHCPDFAITVELRVPRRRKTDE